MQDQVLIPLEDVESERVRMAAGAVTTVPADRLMSSPALLVTSPTVA